VITGCTARLCGAGAGITSANASDKSGNIINGLTVWNWYGSVGAIQLGIPGSYTGNLLNSQISNATLIAETPTYGGPGPAILISATNGFGKVDNAILSNIRIRGAATQGIILQYGDNVHIHNAHISSTTDSCIQINNGVGHLITGSYLDGGSFGVSAGNNAEVLISGSVIRNSGNGLWATSTSTIYNKSNIILNTTSTSTLRDSGALIGFGDIVIPYSTSITPDASKGDVFTIRATNSTAFTINTPIKGHHGQIITITVKNASGGALGTITWSGAYYMSAWTNPSDTFNRSIMFKYDSGSGAWLEVSRVSTDIPS
jgi:hypothetical protein